MAQFRAVQAETREDRARKADKESLEKSRLVERREKFTRYENQGPPTLPATTALGYMTDANRFHSDTAGEEREVREAVVARKCQVIELKREKNIQREERRWSQMERTEQEEAAALQRMSAEGSLKTIRNKSSVSYDPITLEYNKDTDGETLKYMDDIVKWKAKLRSVEMAERSYGDGFNPLTWQPVQGPPKPPAPQPPGHFLDKSSSKASGGHH